ncbi:MAG: hypothetical protein LH606_17220 [Cytophagaceae bacterium]|nr:hypothetical protein [Cytophagaceae bacterium]
MFWFVQKVRSIGGLAKADTGFANATAVPMNKEERINRALAAPNRRAVMGAMTPVQGRYPRKFGLYLNLVQIII